MKIMHDLPDLPERAFQRGPGGAIKPQGGGGKGGSTPKVPDYTAAAQATSQGNLDLAKYATQANRVNQSNPYGSLTWTNNRTFDQSGYDNAMRAYQQALTGQSQGGGGSGDGRYVWSYDGTGSDQDSGRGTVLNQLNGARSGGSQGQLAAPDINNFYSGGDNWSQEVKFSPEMQALFDQQNKISQGLFGSQDAALGRVNQMMAGGFDASSLPTGGDASQLSIYDPNMSTNNATDLLMQRMNPELDRQQEALRTQLANQGIAQGSQAYNQAMSSFGQQRNDAASQAALQGITLGMQQQGQTYGQNLSKQSLANQLRNSSLQEQSYLRSLPLNELNALRSGTQVQMPEFGSYSQQATTGGPDYMGAAQNTYQSQLGGSNAQAAGNSNMMSGLFGLGQLGLGAYGMGMFSDRRLKRNIRRVGTSEKGLGIYSFEYIFGGGMIGYMADEVERVSPGAVRDIGGLKIVNYAEV